MIYHAIWDMMGLVGMIVSVDMVSYLSLAQTLFETIAAIAIIVYMVKHLRKGYKNPEDVPAKVQKRA